MAYPWQPRGRQRAECADLRPTSELGSEVRASSSRSRAQVLLRRAAPSRRTRLVRHPDHARRRRSDITLCDERAPDSCCRCKWLDTRPADRLLVLALQLGEDRLRERSVVVVEGTAARGTVVAVAIAGSRWMSTMYLAKLVDARLVRPAPEAIAAGLCVSSDDWSQLARSLGSSHPANGPLQFVDALQRMLREQPGAAGRVRAVLAAEDPFIVLQDVPAEISEDDWVASRQSDADQTDAVLDLPDGDDVDAVRYRDLPLAWLSRALLARDEGARPTAAELAVELVSVHPDAGFPAAAAHHANKPYAELWLGRRFLLRVLVELERESARTGREPGPIERVLLRSDIDPLCSEATDAFDAIASFVLLQIQRTAYAPIVPDDAFWRGHHEAWWAHARVHGRPLREALHTPSDNQPFAMARYRLWLHPRWTGALTRDVIESVAHWA